MNYNKVRNKLKQYNNQNKDITIQKRGNNYYLFEIYIVNNINDEWIVNKYNKRIYAFDSAPVAILWCMIDKDCDFMLANKIVYMDKILQQKKNNVYHYKELLKQVDNDRGIVTLARIAEDLCRCKNIQNEFNAIIYKYKNMRIKEYDNE